MSEPTEREWLEGLRPEDRREDRKRRLYKLTLEREGGGDYATDSDLLDALDFPSDEDVADAAYALADFHMDFEGHGSYAHWLEPARLALLAVAESRSSRATGPTARRTEEGTG